MLTLVYTIAIEIFSIRKPKYDQLFTQAPMLKQRITDAFLNLPFANKVAVFNAAISLICSSILIIVSVQNEARLVSQSSELFGDSLAKQLALEASNSLVQGDNLSLQSLLNEFVESPLVLHGAIYNVSNRPIAEAGINHSSGQSLSASITFQDSIAGYAVITLDTSPLRRHTSLLRSQLVIITLLLSGGIYFLSLYAARYVSSVMRDLAVIANIPAHQRNPNTLVNYAGDDELQALAKTIISGPDSSPEEQTESSVEDEQCIAVIKITNLSDIERTHGKETAAHLTAGLQQQLSLICQLYDGDRVSIDEANIGICFTSKQDEDSYPFKTLCSAYLALRWQQQQDIPLVVQIGLTLSHNPNDPSRSMPMLIDKAMKIACLDNEIVVDTSLCQHRSVSERVVATSMEASQSMKIEKLLPPYNDLLEKQLNALKIEML